MVNDDHTEADSLWRRIGIRSLESEADGRRELNCDKKTYGKVCLFNYHWFTYQYKIKIIVFDKVIAI